MRNMATITLPHIERMSRERLSTLLTASDPVVVIDVRDSDHVGGHIKSSWHVPSSTLDYTTPGLVRQLRNAPKVVFHCALSQQRGPSAALKYLRERERMFPSSTENATGKKELDDDTRELKGAKTKEGEPEKMQEDPQQEVYVLDGGFVKWQEKYGRDERLTENYDADLWANGY
ncbi:Rhodanese-like domain-containing protein [Tirmania nivea]|nr:Rhodanese-like domain-containing protein [Tirmania nivea]